MSRNKLTERLLAMNDNTHFVSIKQALQLHDELPDCQPGADLSALETALHAPMHALLAGAAPGSLADILAEAILQYRPFTDGNKRTAAACQRLFMDRNKLPRRYPARYPNQLSERE